MAGIGFELRKLSRRDDLIGMVEGYAHSAMASTGPWVFTILTLAAVSTFGDRLLEVELLASFRLIIIYNFAFSLVFSAAIAQTATRYLADGIFLKKLEDAPAMLLSGMVIVFVTGALFAVPFYLFYVRLSLAVCLLALINFFVVSGIWVAAVFLTALKDYDSITGAFAAGMISALVLAVVIGAPFGIEGMLAGLTVGLSIILFALLARIFAEYPYPVHEWFRFGPHLRKFWDLALGGVCYNLGIWADKWIMWLSPSHWILPSGMVSYPDYDSATFLAYLTIVPSMAAFVLSIETDFFERYVKFYRDIQRHATLDQIGVNHTELMTSVHRGARLFIILQGSITVSVILLAPRIFEWLNLSYTQIAMFRVAVLGAFFQVLFLAMLILLSYLDLRRMTLKLQAFFLGSNIAFSLITLWLGFPFYGYGYFLACVLTFAVAFLMIARVLNRLPYQTFVLGNSSLLRHS